MTPPTQKIAIVAALGREVAVLTKNWKRVLRPHDARTYTFFEHSDIVCVCGGIGVQAARRATEAVIALYNPVLVRSVGFAGALDTSMRVGDIFTPSVVLDARDGSRFQIPGGQGTLVTFMEVAGTSQKKKLASAYAAQAVDMEAAGVAAAAGMHDIAFAATKVISDEAGFEIPDMAKFIDSEGQFRTAAFVLFAALHPWLWTRIAALAANSRHAAYSLARHLESSFGDQRTLPSSTTTATVGRGRH